MTGGVPPRGPADPGATWRLGGPADGRPGWDTAGWHGAGVIWRLGGPADGRPGCGVTCWPGVGVTWRLGGPADGRPGCGEQDDRDLGLVIQTENR